MAIRRAPNNSHSAQRSSDSTSPILQPFVAVLGMHRSGTSALTRALVNLGLGLPPGQILTGDTSNPTGHFESIDLIDLNEALLRQWGSTAFSPPVRPDLPAPHQAQSLQRDLRLLLAKMSHPWVWKDPRLCLTLGFWRDTAPPSACVLIWRHPQDVSSSLKRRDQSPHELGSALWYVYNHSALSHAVGLPTYVVNANDLLEAPEYQLNQIIRFVSSHVPSVPYPSVTQGVSAIEPGLMTRTEEHRSTYREDEQLMDYLRSVSGGHAELPRHSLPTITKERAAFIESRRPADLDLWDARSFINTPRVLALSDSILDADDLRMLDSVKRRALQYRVVRYLGRLVRRQWIG